MDLPEPEKDRGGRRSSRAGAEAAQVQGLAAGFDLPGEFVAGLNPATIKP